MLVVGAVPLSEPHDGVIFRGVGRCVSPVQFCWRETGVALASVSSPPGVGGVLSWSPQISAGFDQPRAGRSRSRTRPLAQLGVGAVVTVTGCSVGSDIAICIPLSPGMVPAPIADADADP